MLITIVIGAMRGDTSASRQLATSACLGLPVIAMWVFAFLLWWRADSWGRRMVPDAPETEAAPHIDTSAAMAIAFSAVGAMLVVPALHTLAQTLCRAFFRAPFSDISFSDFWYNASWQTDLWTGVAQVLVSAWLLLGARGVARAVLWLRRAPIEPDDQ